MKSWWILIAVLALTVAGCSGGKKDAAETKQADEQAEPQHAEMPPPVEQAKPAEPRTHEAPPKPAEERPRVADAGPVTKLATLSSGYAFQAALNEKLSTESDQAGHAFEAKLTQPAVLKAEGEVVPAGSRIRGEVTFAKRAARVGGKAEMTLEFRELLTPDGKSYPLFAEPLVLEGKSTAGGDVEKTVGGAVGGAILGGILGGEKGALKGGAAGGAAGAVWAVATRGNDIVIDPGQVLQVKLTRALRVTVTEPSRTALP